MLLNEAIINIKSQVYKLIILFQAKVINIQNLSLNYFITSYYYLCSWGCLHHFYVYGENTTQWCASEQCSQLHIQWHHTGSLKLVQVFTPWKSENATNQGSPSPDPVGIYLLVITAQGHRGWGAGQSCERETGPEVPRAVPPPTRCNQSQCGSVSFTYWAPM